MEPMILKKYAFGVLLAFAVAGCGGGGGGDQIPIHGLPGTRCHLSRKGRRPFLSRSWRAIHSTAALSLLLWLRKTSKVLSVPPQEPAPILAQIYSL